MYVLSEITVQFDPVTYTVTEGVGVVANVTIVSNRAIQGPTVLRVTHNAGSATGECDCVTCDHVTLITNHACDLSLVQLYHKSVKITTKCHAVE